MVVALKVGVESTSEQHDCASFGALDLRHDGERIKGVVCQGNRYGFLFMTVARVGSVRHLRSEAVFLKGCSLLVFKASHWQDRLPTPLTCPIRASMPPGACIPNLHLAALLVSK